MTTKTSESAETKLPKYYAYVVTQGAGVRTRWIQLGAAFAHHNGEGLTLILDSLPIHFDGRIVLRPPIAE